VASTHSFSILLPPKPWKQKLEKNGNNKNLGTKIKFLEEQEGGRDLNYRKP